MNNIFHNNQVPTLVNAQKHINRGVANHGWLNSYHSFSFGSYYNPQEMGFSDLLVINEDKVKANKGFAPHSHNNMEIFSYVLEGSLEHKDSIGNKATIVPGDVQLMSAGSGVNHSEYNPSITEDVHFLQIWIKPNENNTIPSYQQQFFSNESKRGQLKLIISNNGEKNSLTIKQDIKIYAGLFNEEENNILEVDPSRYQYIHVVAGEIKINDILLKSGEALKIRGGNKELYFNQGKNAHILVFDMKK